MPSSRAARLTLLALFAVVMLATRIHHFSALPDASWALFFIGGFYLSAWSRWAFPLLMALAVAIDWMVVGHGGQHFWDHYCVSPGYAMLLPAHAMLWLGGALLARLAGARASQALRWLAPCLFIAIVLCHAFAQGGFYWLSDSWQADGAAVRSLAGWWKNYLDWLPAYLKVTALYVGIAALAHLLIAQLAGLRASRATAG